MRLYLLNYLIGSSDPDLFVGQFDQAFFVPLVMIILLSRDDIGTSLKEA
jgi:hypothetical protein